MRFRNPDEENAMLAALRAERPRDDFADRVTWLMRALREAGADAQLGSTVRHRERGYLMWGAFELSRARSEDEVEALCRKLDARNVEWGLGVPITWRHPRGWAATRDAARVMTETYDVVYATEAGARASSHYGGRAVDLTVTGLPRSLELTAPNGARKRFDLSGEHETRELSLTPEIVEWVEAQLGFEKLHADYPHWNDAR
jgi:hypothetical protein